MYTSFIKGCICRFRSHCFVHIIRYYFICKWQEPKSNALARGNYILLLSSYIVHTIREITQVWSFLFFVLYIHFSLLASFWQLNPPLNCSKHNFPNQQKERIWFLPVFIFDWLIFVTTKSFFHPSRRQEWYILIDRFETHVHCAIFCH